MNIDRRAVVMEKQFDHLIMERKISYELMFARQFDRVSGRFTDMIPRKENKNKIFQQFVQNRNLIP